MESKLNFLERLLGSGKYSQSTQEAEFTCCYPGCTSKLKGKKKLSVNLETDRWHCWVCEKGGYNLYNLISHVGTREDVGLYSKYHKSKEVKRTFRDAPIVLNLSLPDSFVPLVNCRNSFVGKRAYRYLFEKRGLSEQDILQYKIGLCTSGEFADRVIFPSFSQRGYLNFFTGRSLEDGSYYVPKVPREYKSQIILNELNIDWTEPVTIVEGFVDMLKANRNTVPLFGSSLHKDTRLFQAIVENEVPVFLALDADAMRKSHKIATYFREYNIPVYRVDVTPYKDVGEMTKEEFMKRYNEAILVTEKQIMQEKLRALV